MKKSSCLRGLLTLKCTHLARLLFLQHLKSLSGEFLQGGHSSGTHPHASVPIGQPAPSNNSSALLQGGMTNAGMSYNQQQQQQPPQFSSDSLLAKNDPVVDEPLLQSRCVESCS